MNTTLQPEATRCHGFCCPLRERCQRYTLRETGAMLAPLMSHLCEKEGRGRFVFYAGVSREVKP